MADGDFRLLEQPSRNFDNRMNIERVNAEKPSVVRWISNKKQHFYSKH